MTKAPNTPVTGASPVTAKPAAKLRAKPRANPVAAMPAVAVVATARPRPVVVPEPKPAQDTAAEGPVVRKKEFLERVLASSGAKKKDAQSVVDAVLRVMGEAFSKGETLILPPLGKARVGRQVDRNGGEMLVVKLRRGGGAQAGKGKKTADEALAEAED